MIWRMTGSSTFIAPGAGRSAHDGIMRMNGRSGQKWRKYLYYEAWPSVG